MCFMQNYIFVSSCSYQVILLLAFRPEEELPSLLPPPKREKKKKKKESEKEEGENIAGTIFLPNDWVLQTFKPSMVIIRY